MVVPAAGSAVTVTSLEAVACLQPSTPWSMVIACSRQTGSGFHGAYSPLHPVLVAGNVLGIEQFVGGRVLAQPVL